MEISTLARAFPDRIMPGFGHGVGSWMSQIGAAPKSSMKTLSETVRVVRQLLNWEDEMVLRCKEKTRIDVRGIQAPVCQKVQIMQVIESQVDYRTINLARGN
jgi:5,10-methylenetetrahydromethanopterin reductase